MKFEVTKTPSCTIKIYIAGPIEIAKQLLREYCLSGLCVNISESLYIYTGGEEIGYTVGIENYPRFPSSVDALTIKAVELAEKLITGTHQSSGMVVTPVESIFISRRNSLPLKNTE